MTTESYDVEGVVRCEACGRVFPEDHTYDFGFHDPNDHEDHGYRLCYQCGEPVANILHLITLPGVVPLPRKEDA